MVERFKTIAEFVDWLAAFQSEQRTWPVHWFRGHPHRGLELRPRVLRRPLGESALPPEQLEPDEAALEAAERQINQQFRRESASLLPSGLDVVELYFLAQHHGLPTRLLDWTTNGLAALFFTAVRRPEEDGEVIVASPDWRLTTDDPSDPRVEVLDGAPFPQRHHLVVEATEYLFGDGERPQPPMILPVLPDLSSPRMLQQGACFTLHTPGSGPVRENAVARFVIPSEQKADLVRALRALGVNWSTLFPDLDHLCLELRSRWHERLGHLEQGTGPEAV